ncbi:MAG: PAS domain S-box protein [Deltaproteobacteria bacterium]|nr:PAS domain S-box protein [Deltaproteobacteria bacterium]
MSAQVLTLEDWLRRTGLPLVLLDRECKVRAYTPAAAEMLDLTGESAGRHLSANPSLAGLTGLEARLAEALTPAGPGSLVLMVDDRYFEATLTPQPAEAEEPGGLLLHLQDVTQARRDAEELRRQNQMLQASQEELRESQAALRSAFRSKEASLGRLRALLDFSAAAMEQPGIPELEQSIAATARAITGAREAFLARREGTGALVWRAGAGPGAPPGNSPDQPADMPAPELCQNLLEGRGSLRLTDWELGDLPLWPRSRPGAAALRGLLAAALLEEGEGHRGFLAVTDRAEGGDFTPDDEAALTHLASLASLALHHLAARAEATESKEILDALMEHAPVGLTIAAGPEVRLLRSSRWGLELAGFDVAEVNRRGYREHGLSAGLFRADGVTPARGDELPLTRAVLQGEVVRNEEWVIQAADGRKVPLICDAGPVRDRHGRVTGGVVCWRDITELKEKERDLEESRNLYQIMGETVPYGLWRTDAQGHCTYVSQSFLELVGQTLEEAIQFGWTQALPPDEAAATTRKWLECVASGCDWEQEHHFRGRDGRSHTILAVGRPVRNQIGEITSWVGWNLDITARKRAEAALADSEARFRAIFEEATVAICQVDLDGHFLRVNHSAQEFFGFGAKELAQMNFRQVTHPDDLAADLTQMERLLRGEADSYSLEKRYLRKDGRVVWGLLHGAVVRDGLGRPQYFIAAVEDITQLRRDAQVLEQANQELSQFAYACSHDLKAPLRAISNYASFLAEDLAGKLPPEQESYLRSLRGAAREGEKLVNDLLELSRFGETGRGPARSHLSEAVEQALQLLDPPPEVEVVLPPAWPEVKAELSLVQQIMLNLLSNALKFNQSSPKRVEVGWRLAGMGWVEVFVRDNGVGFEARYHDQLFQVFKRLHPREEFEGTGLGLALVQKGVQKLGGRVWAESTPGTGSTFYFTLPVPPLPREDAE